MRVKIGQSSFEVVNLTQPLALGVEVYPGDPKPQRKIFSKIEKTGYQHFVHEIGDHNFQPHADAPRHQNPETEKGIETWGPEFEFNRAFLIDLSFSPGAKEIQGIKYLIKIEKKDLEPFKKQLSEVGAVLLRSGYDRHLEENRPHTPENLPYLTDEAALFLASFENLKIVGIDSLTVDPVGSHSSHQALKEKMIVESLVHLSQISPKSFFTLQVSPVKIIGATGGPVVAYAYFD